MGVTGAHGTLNAHLPDLCRRVHEYSGNVPIAVGFGVSTREHFLSVGAIAEGVVIGSQIVTVLGVAPEGAAEKRECVRKYCSDIVGRQNIQTTHPVTAAESLEKAVVDGEGHPDEFIKRKPDGPGLMDQLEALNDHLDAHPDVSFTFLYYFWVGLKD